jgi:small-conductance mechanosensitive channel
MNILERTFSGNTLKAWVIALSVALASFVILSIIKKVIYRRFKAHAERTATDIDDFVADLIGRIKFFFLLMIAVFLSANLLYLPTTVRTVINKLMVIVLLFQGAIWGNGLFDCWRERSRRQKKEEDPSSQTTYQALGFLFRVLLWSLVLLLALDNLGVNITALIAGLGVGGIAVALALQNILGDLFAHISIILDKPFVLGDFIIVDNHWGTVEHIGIKTTRLRSLSGEQIVLSNSDLLKSRIKNYQRMEERRAVFSVGVTYQTPAEKLAAIPRLIREAVEAQDLTRFDRSNLKEFGDFSLNFENVYYVQTPDYNKYMNIQEAINLAIFRRFKEEGIEFAYPTQTVFVENIPPDHKPNVKQKQ